MAQNSRMQYVREYEIDIDKIAQEAVDAAQDILITKKQDTLVSGENIKTINGTSVLGSGDVTVQEPLVSGTNIKTINGTSVLGSGDIEIESGGLILKLYARYLYNYNDTDFENKLSFEEVLTIFNNNKSGIIIYEYDPNKTLYNKYFICPLLPTKYSSSYWVTAIGQWKNEYGHEVEYLYKFELRNVDNFAFFVIVKTYSIVEVKELFPSGVAGDSWNVPNTAGIYKYCGVLDNLTTTTKTNLVAAINELVTRVAALEA